MKLLFCPNCKDVFNLKQDVVKSCSCGQTSGKYNDNFQAEYTGGVPVGFANRSFIDALNNQPAKGLGRRFEAFVIPKECPTFINLEKEQ